MNTSFPGDDGSDAKRRIRPLASLPGFGVIWTWLTRLIRLTKHEEEDAGIYLGD